MRAARTGDVCIAFDTFDFFPVPDQALSPERARGRGLGEGAARERLGFQETPGDRRCTDRDCLGLKFLAERRRIPTCRPLTPALSPDEKPSAEREPTAVAVWKRRRRREDSVVSKEPVRAKLPSVDYMLQREISRK